MSLSKVLKGECLCYGWNCWLSIESVVIFCVSGMYLIKLNKKCLMLSVLPQQNRRQSNEYANLLLLFYLDLLYTSKVFSFILVFEAWSNGIWESPGHWSLFGMGPERGIGSKLFIGERRWFWGLIDYLIWRYLLDMFTWGITVWD